MKISIMKALKIIFIVNAVLMGIFFFALTGAQGQINLKNKESIHLLIMSIVMISVAIYSYKELYKTSTNKSTLYVVLLLVAIIIQAFAIIKVTDVSPMTDSDSWFIVLWLSFNIALSIYFMVKKISRADVSRSTKKC